MIFIWAFGVLFLVALILVVGVTAIVETVKLFRPNKQDEIVSNGYCPHLQNELKNHK